MGKTGGQGMDRALDALEGAVDRLERTLVAIARPARPAPGRSDGGDRIAELEAERDCLAAENEELRANAARDAELRSEATAAVKAALEDLRALMPEGASHG